MFVATSVAVLAAVPATTQAGLCSLALRSECGMKHTGAVYAGAESWCQCFC